MKKLMAVLAVVPMVAMAEMKIGTVEMMTLVRNHKSYESNKQFLSASEKESQAKLDSMRKDIEKIEADGRKLAEEAQNPMLAESRRKELEKQLIEIQKKYVAGQQALRSEAMRAQQDLQSMETKFLKITSDDLRKTINAFAEKNKYDLIIDSSAAPYSKKNIDCTDGVLKEMGVDPAKAIKSPADETNADESK